MTSAWDNSSSPINASRSKISGGAVKVRLVSFSLIFFSYSLTVTVQVSVYPPSSVATVIVVCPSPTALIVPCSSTVATDGSADVQYTFLFDAFSGVTYADSCPLPPVSSVNACSESIIPVTETTSGTTRIPTST